MCTPRTTADDEKSQKPKIWMDGCFDFSHHGHANAILQAKRLASALIVGVHSDEEIMYNKGPPVMNLKERLLTVQSFKWVDGVVSCSPYVTSLEVMDEAGCDITVHGDDVTTDADGNDAYRNVKEAGRFEMVPRTKNISTTDLVGRMLLYSRSHFIKDDNQLFTGENLQRLQSFSTGPDGLSPHTIIWHYSQPTTKLIVPGISIPAASKLVYVDGGFDLFSSGHISFLKLMRSLEPNAYIVAGIHSDYVINKEKGLNYPIMNLYERSLCVLACRYVDGVLISAPYVPKADLGLGHPIDAVYHGQSSIEGDPYAEIKKIGIYKETPHHDFEEVNAKAIVDRIVNSREAFEARQRKKLGKSEAERLLKDAEKNLGESQS